MLQFSPAPPCHPGNRDPLGVCGTTEIWGSVACDLGEATSASHTSASQYFSWLLEGFLEVLFTLVENGPSASSPPLPAPSSVLLTLELTLKLWKTMLFFFLSISYGPQGKASCERQIHKYLVKTLRICSSSKGKEISCNKPLLLHRKASKADPPRGSWPPFSAFPISRPPGWRPLSSVFLQDSGLLPTQACAVTDGDYQYPQGL